MNRVTWDLIGATLKESIQSSLPSFAVLNEQRGILTFLFPFSYVIFLFPSYNTLDILGRRLDSLKDCPSLFGCAIYLFNCETVPVDSKCKVHF